MDKWTKAFTESDVDGIVKLYAPDALFFGTGSKTLVTKTADIRKYFEAALLSNRPRGVAVGKNSVMELSDTGVVVTGLDTLTGTRDGKITSANGRVTFVVAKRFGEYPILQSASSTRQKPIIFGKSIGAQSLADLVCLSE